MLLPAGQEVLTIATSFGPVTFAVICKITIAPSMMAFFSGTVQRTPSQEAYNSAHTKTRRVIEQTSDRWKRRFHVLHAEIRMAPEKVCMIVGACAVFHNISLLLQKAISDVLKFCLRALRETVGEDIL